MHRGAPKELASSSWGFKTGRELEDEMQLSCGMPATPNHEEPCASQLPQVPLLWRDGLVTAKQAGGALAE